MKNAVARFVMDSVAREQVAVNQIAIAKQMIDHLRKVKADTIAFPDLQVLDEASGQLAEALEILEM